MLATHMHVLMFIPENPAAMKILLCSGCLSMTEFR